MSGNTATAQVSKTEQVAVAYLVDSSLTLMSEWTRLMEEYLNPLLQRLHESHPNRMVSLQPYKHLISAEVLFVPSFVSPSYAMHLHSPVPNRYSQLPYGSTLALRFRNSFNMRQILGLAGQAAEGLVEWPYWRAWPAYWRCAVPCTASYNTLMASEVI